MYAIDLQKDLPAKLHNITVDVMLEWDCQSAPTMVLLKTPESDHSQIIKITRSSERGSNHIHSRLSKKAHTNGKGTIGLSRTVRGATPIAPQVEPRMPYACARERVTTLVISEKATGYGESQLARRHRDGEIGAELSLRDRQLVEALL